jgi:hypothetical protein
MRKLVLAITILFCAFSLNAQQNRFFYTNTFINHFLDTSINKHASVEIPVEANLTQAKDTTHGFLYRRLFQEHHAYLKGEDFALSFDFIPDFQIGKESPSGKTLWLNTRGFAIQAQITEKLYLYSDLYENQGVFPTYLDKSFGHQSGVNGQALLRTPVGGVLDYSYSSALLDYKASKFFNLQLGYGKNFIGNGYRSMLLSDFSPNYPFLNVDFKVGPFFYRAHYAQHVDPFSDKFSYDNGFRKKYAAIHYLDWNISKRWSLGLFESVVWQGADSNGYRGFDIQYLNPVIFLRPLEFAIGSPDNALLGINLSYKPHFSTIVYGQFLLDEFHFEELTSGNGWWANKYASQLGVRVFNLGGLKGLHGLTEYNSAMPYTYSQRTTLLNYAHLGQSLAHPVGANFRECLVQLKYVKPKWSIAYQYQYLFQGVDSTGNVGSNIFKSYFTRDNEYGNYIGQGLKSITSFHQANLCYYLNDKNNWRIELNISHRNNPLDTPNSSWFYTIGIRSSFRSLYYDY